MENQIFEQKKSLRKRISELKKGMKDEQKKVKSEHIFQIIEKQPWFLSSRCMMAFWSMNDEVQTKDFILKWADSKTILLPVVQGNELELRIFEGESSMKIGQAFGILEPNGKVFFDFDEIDLIIVPGVAFDRNMNRLGRGKAYYDKLLPKTVNAFKVGVCFDFQLISEVPADLSDVKMDEVISA